MQFVRILNTKLHIAVALSFFPYPQLLYVRISYYELHLFAFQISQKCRNRREKRCPPYVKNTSIKSINLTLQNIGRFIENIVDLIDTYIL